MAIYTPVKKDVWKGRIDGKEEDVLRWHQVMQVSDLENNSLPVIEEHQQGIALIGFCCDEGVKRNNGRAGAAGAPLSIRNACCNFPVFASHIMMVDAGDVACPDGNLEAAQQLLGEKIQVIRHSGYLPIVIGGGHEVAFANFKGIIPFLPNQEFGLINFDAHFDLRQVQVETGATSGTGISQIKSWCDDRENPFHYLVIGIQPYSNTRKLFETANKMDAVYILSEEFTEDQIERIITIVNGILGNADVLQLTIDMDVFASPFSPGVSAPSPGGLLPNNMFKRLLRHIILSGKVASVDLAETNPLYDLDNRTSRLAASLIFDIVQAADVNADW
jgi:formiminoglutamase